ncbi:MAG: alpha/beta hydrolase [Holophagales bacterium]|nr:alpha/beta hydrolase [Holophagales bacterium]
MTRHIGTKLTHLGLLGIAGAAALGGAAPPATEPPLLGTKDYVARALVPADERFEYGSGPSRFADLYLPKGVRPYRLVVFFHGGCWMSEYGLDPVGGFCRALADETGLAVLNVEYRRAGEEGGGWPGTFHDAAAALDFVDELSTRAPVSSRGVIVAGHSAGAHLALWLAARAGLPFDDPLRTPVRIRPSRVVALAPLADLADVPGTACAGALDGLLGPPSLRETRLRSASPAARLPLGVPQVLVAGRATGSSPSLWPVPTPEGPRCRRCGLSRRDPLGRPLRARHARFPGVAGGAGGVPRGALTASQLGGPDSERIPLTLPRCSTTF